MVGHVAHMGEETDQFGDPDVEGWEDTGSPPLTNIYVPGEGS
jgi:hypothetical protein